MTAVRTLDNTPINTGLDYERAREMLANRYGEAFNAYITAKREALGETIIFAKLDEAREIQKELRALRPDDTDRIASILRGD
jgi:hypothetical protein